MERIKANIQEHKKLYLGLSILVAMALACVILRFVFYKVANKDSSIPYADIGDICIVVAYFIGLFMGILLVGSLLWLIATKIGSKLHASWYIIIVNTLVVFFDIYTIVDDMFLSSGWFQGLVTMLICVFVIPVNIVVYIFCIIRLRICKKKASVIRS